MPVVAKKSPAANIPETLRTLATWLAALIAFWMVRIDVSVPTSG